MELFQDKKEKLENEVRELINRVTNSKYTSPLDIKYEEGLWVLRLGLNCKEAAPICFGFQGDETGFLCFLEKEFRKRKLQNVEYTKETLINGDTNVFYPVIEL